MFAPLQLIFQIRRKSIISYDDYSTIPKSNKEKSQKEKIIQKGKFTISAQSRMKKITELFYYSIHKTNKELSFITLTISSEKQKGTNYTLLLKKFIETIENRYNGINYIWKLELQKNGNPHFHIMADEKIDWKTVRKSWNKIQKTHVDSYQKKMQEKYKRGFYFDETMKNKDGTPIDEETQIKRYKLGYKANWRNPNSTDTKIIEANNETVGNYINKYISKIEDEKEDNNFNRWWGCNDKIRKLKYATINETEVNLSAELLLKKNEIKKITDENYRIKCTIYDKIKEQQFETIEAEQIAENLQILNAGKNINKKLIEKDVKKYNKLFAD